MALLLLFVLMVILLLLKGFFSGSEIALVNSDKIRMHHRARQGDAGAQLLLKMFERPDVALGTTLVGTNIATVALTTLGTLVCIELFGERGDLYAFLILTPVLLVLGEIVPKSIYQQKADVLAPIIVYPLRFASRLFYPVIFVFSRVARLGVRLAGVGRAPSNVFITREQLRSVVEMTERASSAAAFEQGRIRRAIRFADTLAGEAMTPLAEAIVLGRNRSVRDVIQTMRKHGLHRIPVHKGNASNIIGVVVLSPWDLMDPALGDRTLAELLCPPLYVTPFQTLDELLPALRQREDRMAIVVDEFGSAVGVLTVEDIMEQVVGEVEVGYHFEEATHRHKASIEPAGDGAYLVDSRLPISEANDVLGIDLPEAESRTLGGLVTARLRRIPAPGDSIVEAGFRFTVAEANERTIIKLRVEPMVGPARGAVGSDSS